MIAIAHLKSRNRQFNAVCIHGHSAALSVQCPLKVYQFHPNNIDCLFKWVSRVLVANVIKLHWHYDIFLGTVILGCG